MFGPSPCCSISSLVTSPPCRSSVRTTILSGYALRTWSVFAVPELVAHQHDLLVVVAPRSCTGRWSTGACRTRPSCPAPAAPARRPASPPCTRSRRPGCFSRNRIVFWSTHSIDSRPLPLLLLPTNGPRRGRRCPPGTAWRRARRRGTGWRSCRSTPYLTSAQVIGEPSSHLVPWLRVNSQTVLPSLGRPVSVARSPDDLAGRLARLGAERGQRAVVRRLTLASTALVDALRVEVGYLGAARPR